MPLDRGEDYDPTEGFVQRDVPSASHCGDHETWGKPSSKYTWIYKGNKILKLRFCT